MQPGDGVAPRSAHPLAPTFLTRRCARGTGAAAPPLPGRGAPALWTPALSCAGRPCSLLRGFLPPLGKRGVQGYSKTEQAHPDFQHDGHVVIPASLATDGVAASREVRRSLCL